MKYSFNFEENYTDDIFECGIYKIYYEKTPNKVYVGSALKQQKENKYKKSSGFWYRFRNHTTKLSMNKHHSIKLQNAFNKYGDKGLILEIIEIRNDCIEQEQYWIDYYDSYNKGYNCAPNAGSMKGFNHSEYSKNKMSVSKKLIRQSYLSNILKYRAELKSCKEIAKLLSINYHTVGKILKENGHSVDKMLSRRIKIYQYNIITGELIKEWNSISECMRITGIHSSKLVVNLKGKTMTCFGYHFNYNVLPKEGVLNIVKNNKSKYGKIKSV